jgi:hypothetical protein
MDHRNVLSRFEDKLAAWKRDWRLIQLTRQIANNVHPEPNNPTVAFFLASTRLTGISLNAAFAYLTACGLQVAGVPVVYFACRAGMSRCVLGTNWQNPSQAPPCGACIAQSRRLFAHAPTVDFTFQEDEALRKSINDLSVSELSGFVYPAADGSGIDQDIQLGDLVLPSIRWANRLHNLPDDKQTRFLFREYIISAWRVANEFVKFLDQTDPQILVVFNGVFYPEATVRWVAQQRGLRVITHEVGFRPFSAFFTDKHATAYPVEILDEYELTPEQNSSLEEYLRDRFKGEFTMAGIQFWPEMRKMDDNLIHKASQFKQIIPVFTNVIFDTSQVHANTIFEDMFAWLDVVLEIIMSHPETFFVIRAHPDELRPGKQSRESVPDWIAQNHVDRLKNVQFIGPTESLSSYDLIQRSKFVMLYNSSIGLEAALMGKAVLCGGKARYTQNNIVYFPDSPEEYRQMAEDFLEYDGRIEIPDEFVVNARRYLYFQFFKASLPFDEYLEEDTKPGYVRLKPMSWRKLKIESSQTMQTLLDGILHAKPFLLGDAE